jgi:hypothetical protein
MCNVQFNQYSTSSGSRCGSRSNVCLIFAAATYSLTLEVEARIGHDARLEGAIERCWRSRWSRDPEIKILCQSKAAGAACFKAAAMLASIADMWPTAAAMYLPVPPRGFAGVVPSAAVSPLPLQRCLTATSGTGL